MTYLYVMNGGLVGCAVTLAFGAPVDEAFAHCYWFGLGVLACWWAHRSPSSAPDALSRSSELLTMEKRVDERS